MPPRIQDHPTAAEMEILQGLWKIGRATVREIQQELNRLRPTHYTTALKLLQTMKSKGLVGREDHDKAHVYWAVITEREVRTRVLRGVIERVFQGSFSSLVVHAVEHGKLGADDLAAVRQVLKGERRVPPAKRARKPGKRAGA